MFSGGRERVHWERWVNYKIVNNCSNCLTMCYFIGKSLFLEIGGIRDRVLNMSLRSYSGNFKKFSANRFWKVCNVTKNKLHHRYFLKYLLKISEGFV